MAAAVGKQQEYAIGGFSIKFPCKPYSTQMAMMAKIIQALVRRENALLESPTGSGKSLALLCSALAWQRQSIQKSEKDVIDVQMADLKTQCCECLCHRSLTLPVAEAAAPTANQPPPAVVQKSTATPNTTPQVLQDNQSAPSTVASTVVLKTEEPPASEEVGGAVSDGVAASEGKQVKEEAMEVAPEGAAAEGDKKVAGSSGGGVGTDDDDFKQSKKRFRTPASSAPVMKRRRKGVCYEDESGSETDGDGQVKKEEEEEEPSCLDDNGRPLWRMEMKGDGPPVTTTSSSVAGSGGGGGGVGEREGTTFDSGVSAVPIVCPKCGCSQGAAGGQEPAKAAVEQPSKRKGGPQIYFCTRTHKQITQITHEMARTAYTDSPMVILASREHTCVHPTVSSHKNKNDECKKLLDYDQGVGCRWYHRVQNRLSCQSHLQQYGLRTAWDIEDLVRLGKRITACPYYATRSLKDEADIIFCPYNYLIDPMIREQLLIDINRHVIIFDEAHNMEDSARSAASLTLTSLQVKDVLEDIDEILNVLESRELLTVYKQLQALCRAITRWMDATAQRLPPRGFEQSCGIWPGTDFLPILERELGLTFITVGTYTRYLKLLNEPERSEKEKNGRKELDKPPCISMSSIMLLKSLLIVVGYLLKDNKKYLPDYRVALLKTTASRPVQQQGEFISRRRRSRKTETVWTYSLNFWCLNPAVAFSDLEKAHSIILTSGTLSPMSSFSSELGVAFPIQLEANHVIPEAQTWVRSLSHGPNNKSLIANYQNSETFQFQDEVGSLVLQVCQIVPYGVLCFLSSYNMLEKLCKRWQETGLWYQIMKCKTIVTEPRSGAKADFEAAMVRYYEAISDYQHAQGDEYGDSEGACTGALFFAVCRGKVSEGLDFTDNNARAVITIGIPFPYIKDKQVELKREYNNEHFQRRGLLNGSEWYEIQAYRALNQALGRCIRHKKDWGAVILVDERFAKGAHYTKGLSKWIRKRLQHQSNFQQAMASLHSFTTHMLQHTATTTASEQSSMTSTTDHSLLLNPPSAAASSSLPLLPHSSSSPSRPGFVVGGGPSDPTLASPTASSSPFAAAAAAAVMAPPQTTSTPIGRAKQELLSSPSLPPPGISLASSMYQQHGKSSPSLKCSAQLAGSVNDMYRPQVVFIGKPETPPVPQTSFHQQPHIDTPQIPRQTIAKRTLRDYMTSAPHPSSPSSSSPSSSTPNQPQPVFTYPSGVQAATNTILPLSRLASAVPQSTTTTAAAVQAGRVAAQDAVTVPDSPPTDVVCIDATPPGQNGHDTVVDLTSSSQPSPPLTDPTLPLSVQNANQGNDPLHTVAVSLSAVEASVVPTTPQLPAVDSPVLFGSCTELLMKTPTTNRSSLSSKLSEKVKMLTLQTPPTTPKPGLGLPLLPHYNDACTSPLMVAHKRFDEAVSSLCCGGEKSTFGEEVLADDDPTPPISPHNAAAVEEMTGLKQEPSDTRQILDPSFPRSLKKTKSDPGGEISTKSDSPFGKPKRRSNVRMATRKSAAAMDLTKFFPTSSHKDEAIAGKSSSVSIAADQRGEGDEDGDDGEDFKTSKPLATPKKKAQEETATINCSCGELVSRKAVAYEKHPVKDIFSSVYGSYRGATVQNSKLWSQLRGSGKQRIRCLQALVVAASDLKAVIMKESGVYNSVWEQKLGVCYSVLQCKAGHAVGVHIHTTSNMSALVGKALLSTEAVQLT